MIADAGSLVAPLYLEITLIDNHCIGFLVEIGFGGAGWENGRKKFRVVIDSPDGKMTGKR